MAKGFVSWERAENYSRYWRQSDAVFRRLTITWYEFLSRGSLSSSLCASVRKKTGQKLDSSRACPRAKFIFNGRSIYRHLPRRLGVVYFITYHSLGHEEKMLSRLSISSGSWRSYRRERVIARRACQTKALWAQSATGWHPSCERLPPASWAVVRSGVGMIALCCAAWYLLVVVVVLLLLGVLNNRENVEVDYFLFLTRGIRPAPTLPMF